jgi:hypothetical protein
VGYCCGVQACVDGEVEAFQSGEFEEMITDERHIINQKA